MFTGLVEGRGTVTELTPEGSAIRLGVQIAEAMGGECHVGDSVAINGCCLTVIEVADRCWTFQAGSETLSKTNLGDLKVGGVVNLERPLTATAELGGHFVQGHVDGVGTVSSVTWDGEWVEMWFEVPPPLAEQLVPKGSVAVDGVSLTVVDVTQDGFSVALIPHTLEITTLGVRQIGDAVNIETDILGKYVLKFLQSRFGEGA